MTTKVTFILPAETVGGASEGLLVGEFNNWNQAEAVQLQKKEDGSMIAEIALIAGKSYQYRYLLNDGRWVNDSNETAWSDVYGHSVENCIIHVPVPEKKKAATKKAAVKKPAADVTATKKAAPEKKAAAKKAAARKKPAAPKKAAAVKKAVAPKD